jgi:glycosyltransferase involved in cell wall biosynthesis
MAILETLARSHPKNTHIIDLPKNVGKAEAIRQAMLSAEAWKNFTYIGYWDADLATPLEELEFMCTAALERTNCLIVLGSRIRRLGSEIERRAWRHYLGRGFATMASFVLRLPVYDTQCGAKLLRASVVREVFEQPFLSRWFFDVEMLARLRNLAGTEAFLTRAVEVSLKTWHHVDGSKLTLGSILRAPLDLWRIARRYNRRSV